MPGRIRRSGRRRRHGAFITITRHGEPVAMWSASKRRGGKKGDDKAETEFRRVPDVLSGPPISDPQRLTRSSQPNPSRSIFPPLGPPRKAIPCQLSAPGEKPVQSRADRSPFIFLSRRTKLRGVPVFFRAFGSSVRVRQKRQTSWHSTLPCSRRSATRPLSG